MVIEMAAERKYETIGARLRVLREAAGLSQPQLEAASGIDVSKITKIELGVRRPNPEDCQVLAELLGADEEELLILAQHRIAKPNAVTDDPLDAEYFDLARRLGERNGGRKSFHQLSPAIKQAVLRQMRAIDDTIQEGGR